MGAGGRSVTLMLFFVGVLLIVNGVYEQRYRRLKQNVRVEYRFIPRTLYEEQTSAAPNVSAVLKPMFQDETPGLR
jgi:hypothetical protein